MKMRRKGSAILFVLAMVGIVLVGCGSGSKGERSVVITVSSNQPESHPTVRALRNFAAAVEERSDGTIKFDVQPNGVLGSDRAVLEQVQFGAIQMVSTGISMLEAYNPLYSVFSVPYVFDDFEHYQRFMDSDYAKEVLFKSEMEPYGFYILTWFDAGARSFYTRNKVINEPEDLRGLKLRVLTSQTLMEMVRQMGGSPTPLDWGEVYAALQQGVIDGLENNEIALTVNKHGEVAKEFSNTKHLFTPDVLIVNKRFFDSLSDNQKEILTEEIEKLSLNQRQLWKQATDEAIEEAKGMGVRFTDPDLAAFRASVTAMNEDAAAKYPDFFNNVREQR
jgi:tripartite ATP-independent transporter DctP family solute receptor